jgi:peptidoglycan/LPS O-acetylase OafA/YrhL
MSELLTPPTSHNKRVHLHSLDLLRGLAILMVITVHVTQATSNLPVIIANMGYFGMFGVQLFFVVSAFSLCLAYSENIKYGSVGFPRFMTRRIFRIAPMYVLGIILYWILRQIYGQEQPPWTAVAFHASLLHGLYPPAFGIVVPGGWSIACEFLFYLIFPLLICTLYRSTKVFSLLTLMILVPANLVLTLINGGDLRFDGWSYQSLNILSQLPVFAIGIISYRFWMKKYRFRKSTLFIIFVFCMILVALLKAKWEYANLLTPTLCGLGFSSLLLLLIDVKFRIVWIEKLGLISYSVYIIHFVFTEYYVKYHQNFSFFGNWVLEISCLFALTVAGSVLLSIVTYKFIEVPMIGLGKLVASRF